MTDLTLYTDLSPLDHADLAPGTRRHYKAAYKYQGKNNRTVVRFAPNVNMWSVQVYKS